MRTNPELDALALQLKELRIEFEKYFNGANDLPPAPLQSEIDRRIRTLRGRVRTAIDRFRLSSLEAQNNSYSEMFQRRLRAIEEGRAPRPTKPTLAQPRFDSRAGVVVSGKVGDRAAAALYSGLYTESGSKKVDPDTFRAYLDRQLDLICSKTGCSEVRFRVVSENGKTKLKAKPVRS